MIYLIHTGVLSKMYNHLIHELWMKKIDNKKINMDVNMINRIVIDYLMQNYWLHCSHHGTQNGIYEIYLTFSLGPYSHIAFAHFSICDPLNTLFAFTVSQDRAWYKHKQHKRTELWISLNHLFKLKFAIFEKSESNLSFRPISGTPDTQHLYCNLGTCGSYIQ